VLTPQETEALFVILRKMREQGKTIVFITHKLGEVMEISDRVTVMRRGRVVGVVNTSDSSPAELAMMMVGRRVLFDVEKGPATAGGTVLEVSDVHAMGAARVPRLKGLSLTVRAGEILGVAGVEGNGQTELVEVIAGLRRPSSGRVLLKGEDVTGSSPREMLERGVAHIPEDRLKRALITEFTVGENLILGSQFRSPYAGRVFLNSDAVLANAERVLTEFDVRPRAPFLRAGSLSGGNQQKLVVARELGRKPVLLVAAQPTRGVDIGAIEFIRRCLVSQRDAGTAVLLVSADLSEILSLSDRIAVIFGGRIVSTVDAAATDEKELGLLMTGAGRAAHGASER
jgi:simple sugar transport system ATP-binding protein